MCLYFVFFAAFVYCFQFFCLKSVPQPSLCVKKILFCDTRAPFHSKVNTGDRIHRHNAIRDQLYLDCQAAKLSPQKETAIGTGKKRPGDVFVPVWDRGLGANFDVSVVCPALVPHLSNASQVRSYVASLHEDAKRAKHEASCTAAHTLFIPLVVETYGCWGPSAVPVLKSIGRMIAAQQDIPASTAILRLFQRLSFILQRRNAISILSRSSSMTV